MTTPALTPLEFLVDDEGSLNFIVEKGYYKLLTVEIHKHCESRIDDVRAFIALAMTQIVTVGFRFEKKLPRVSKSNFRFSNTQLLRSICTTKNQRRMVYRQKNEHDCSGKFDHHGIATIASTTRHKSKSNLIVPATRRREYGRITLVQA